MENNKQSNIKEKVKKAFSFASVAGLLIGIIGGFAYYKFIGCSSGGCAITSNPWMSMLWGAMAGYLIGDLFKKKPKTKDQAEN
jgi:hypothetical protein